MVKNLTISSESALMFLFFIVIGITLIQATDTLSKLVGLIFLISAGLVMSGKIR